MQRSIRAAALAGAVALALAACGEAPEETTTAGGDASEEAGSDFKGCMVTDSGGIDDRSFNANAWAGLQAAEESAGITADFLESNVESDFTRNIDTYVADDCGLIVTVGFLLQDATNAAAQANPEEQFAIVDSAPEEPIENVKPLLFNTAEAAFLGGYVAAGMSQSGTVATFGGINIPPVSIFMDGFVDGVSYYNEQNGTDVQALGWDKEAQDGSFTGDFTDQARGQQTAQNFIQQGADIIFPVAGPVGLGAAAAAQATGGEVNLIWVDTDGYESAPDYADLFITSVLKRIDTAVETAVTEAVDGEFSNEPFVGTLENEGVGLAPFHDFEETVPQELKDQVDELREAIIAGEVVVESPSSPSAG